MFEEAYFVLKSEEKTRYFSHATMVAEANRIIEENFGVKKRNFKYINLKTVVAFSLGAFLSFLFAFLVF